MHERLFQLVYLVACSIVATTGRTYGTFEADQWGFRLSVIPAHAGNIRMN